MSTVDLEDVIRISKETITEIEHFDDENTFVYKDHKVSLHFAKPLDVVVLRYWIELQWDLADKEEADIEKYINERNRDNGWMSWFFDKGDKRNDPQVICLISTFLSTPVTKEVHYGMLEMAVKYSKQHEIYFNQNFGGRKSS